MSSKKYAVVTGAASGIGLCVYKLLVSQGVFVFALDKVQGDLGESDYINCDVSSDVDIKEALLRVLEQTDRIDYLVLAAGVLCYEKRYLIEDMPLIEWSTVLAVNLTGVMLSMRAFIPLMKKNGKGSIVTYSSEQVVRPIAKGAPYVVSKAGVETLTKLAAAENLGNNIRVNCIRAAAVNTEFLSSLVKDSDVREKMKHDMHAKMPLGIISPQEIANITSSLLSDTASKMTGQIVTVDSGVLL